MIKKIILVFLFIALYSLPLFIFNINHDYYYSIILPKYAPECSIFNITWLSIYILLGIFIAIYFNKNNFDKSSFIFLILNYIIMFFFNKAFFINHKLYLSFVISLMSFVSMLIVYLSAFVSNRKASTLLIPYLLWTLFITVLQAHIFLIN